VPPEDASAETRDIVARALLKAAELVGGVTPLHHYLNVDRSDLFGWIVGKGLPSEETFLRVVEILIDPQAAQNAVIDHARSVDERLRPDKPPRD
jgi:hypothetical protein